MRYLETDRSVAADPETALLRVAASVAGLPRTTAVRDGVNRVLVTETWRPLWPFVLAILLFPFGLFFLLVRRTAVLTVEANAEGSGSRVHLSGRGHEAVCDQVLSALSTNPRVTVDL